MDEIMYRVQLKHAKPYASRPHRVYVMQTDFVYNNHWVKPFKTESRTHSEFAKTRNRIDSEMRHEDGLVPSLITNTQHMRDTRSRTRSDLYSLSDHCLPIELW